MGSLERSGLSRSWARDDEHPGAVAVLDVGDGRGAADPRQRPTVAVVDQHQHAHQLAGDRDRSRPPRRAGMAALADQHRTAGVGQTAGRRRPRGRAIQPRVQRRADHDQRQRRRPATGQPLHTPERLDEPNIKGKISAYVQPDAVVLYRVTADPGCTVPRLLGKTLQATRASLKTAQCTLGQVTRSRARHARRGRVIAQTPPAGSRRRRGAKVKVVLAS